MLWQGSSPFCFIASSSGGVGYIVAGFIIARTPAVRVIHDEDTIKTLAELGDFLMFCLGLEFSLRKHQVGATRYRGLPGIILMIWIGYEIGQWFAGTHGFTFLGAILAISRHPSSSRRSTT